ncbi:putative secreted protein [Staphylococcus aureus]|uniref:Putative secreted protein n=1 Tax=Staphylococcus aureus TaxID=1280 RepID=A0A380EHC7_STAAU|nr:putative secreted protein [Staphylococcus aureus]
MLSANISAHSEQVYEMTDHQIKNNTINKAYEHKDPTNNSEQRDGKVFALIIDTLSQRYFAYFCEIAFFITFLLILNLLYFVKVL